MTRLINADKLKEALQCKEKECENCTDIDCKYCFNEIIDNAPTVEDRTKEVLSLQDTIAKLVEGIAESTRPTGEWIICNQDNEGIHKIECPFCKYVCGSDLGDQITMTFQKLPNYCEYCGADMRGEK